MSERTAPARRTSGDDTTKSKTDSKTKPETDVKADPKADAKADPKKKPSKPSLIERTRAVLAKVGEDRQDGAKARVPEMMKSEQSGRKPRRARLRLTRVDPWSVMKTAFLLSVAFAIVTFVAIFMVWSVLGAAGVWESINSAVASLVEGDTSTSFDVKDYVGMSRVLGFTLLVSLLNIVLLTALATLSAFLYNLSAALLGGVEVTLAEDER